jgi:hypothetical protein
MVELVNMTKETISSGTVHAMLLDIKKALTSDKAALAAWEDLTPLARNEWICWVSFVKKAETREEHIERLIKQLKEGKRRPCCWIGCIHRTDKAISPSVQGILTKRSKKK